MYLTEHQDAILYRRSIFYPVAQLKLFQVSVSPCSNKSESLPAWIMRIDPSFERAPIGT